MNTRRISTLLLAALLILTLLNANAETALAPIDELIEAPIDFTDAYAAYAETLIENRNAILAYDWSAQDNEPVSGGRVVIADICGDAVPELIFIKAEGDSPDDTNLWRGQLYIYAHDTVAREILFVDLFDYNAGGGCHYAIFQTESGDFYTYTSGGDEEWTQTYTRYTFEEGNLIPAQTLTQRTLSSEDYPETAFNYYLDESEIDVDMYISAATQITGIVAAVLARSYRAFDEATFAQNEPLLSQTAAFDTTTMTYGEALAFLAAEGGIELQEDIALEDILQEEPAQEETVEEPAQTQMPAGIDALIVEGQIRNYTREELTPLSKAELRLARNGLYALSGKIFRSADLREYFSVQAWYTPTNANDSATQAKFNDYQNSNLKLIISVEREKGYR